MGTAINHCLPLAGWLFHRLPDTCEGTAPKNRGKAPNQVDLSIGQFTNREADRSKDRSPPAAFAHASASQRFCTVPVPPVLPLTPRSWPPVSTWHRPKLLVVSGLPKLSLGQAQMCNKLWLFVTEQRITRRGCDFSASAWSLLVSLLSCNEMGAVRSKQRQRHWIAMDRGIA